jgi:subtilase family serine protease
MGAWQSEMVWNWGGGIGSGGGISQIYPIPVWQQGISMSANRGSATMRNIPDVALTADNILVIADNGISKPGTGGTSAAAPLWAGFTALVNQQAAAVGQPPVGFLNPTIYTVGMERAFMSCFHDITTGNNTSSGSPNLFFAAPGYDLCIGWGTPKGNNLINMQTVLAPWIISQPQGQTVTAGESAGFSVIAGGMAPLNYQWLFNGQPISTATSYSYSIARVQSSQAGTYTVLVSNSFGSVQSAPATLAIASGTAFGIIGVPFHYPIIANNNPTWYSASGLPSGLSCNGTTGLISGTPA